MITIRKEQNEDLAAIHEVIARAFGGSAEAELVDRLRANGKAVVSLVAVADAQVVGHILFSSATIEKTAGGTLDAIGLAPLAVLPEFQNRGVGALLTRAGLAACREAGYQRAIVLGHPHYYPRFGFVAASRYGIRSEYDVRDEVFMALELEAGALQDAAGLAKYQPEFNED